MSEESRQELKPCPGCGRMRYKRNMSPDGFCMICASIKARADSKPTETEPVDLDALI